MSIWTDWTLTIDEDGGGRLEGVETGRLTVHSLEHGVLVLHEAGHHYWSRIGGEWPYAPAQLHVLAVGEIVREGDRLCVSVTDHRATLPVRRYEPPERIAARLANV